MNSIPEIQNSPLQLRRLAAHRQLYSTAKNIFGWQAFLMGPIAVGLTFVALEFPYVKGYVACWGLIMSLSDVLWLIPWQKRLRTRAAVIQEEFDCDTLALPWNEIKIGKHPVGMEIAKEQADKYKKRASQMPPLKNWYPPEVGRLPLHIARVICQRSNIWWDSKQRRSYAIFILSFVIGIFLIVLFLAMQQKFILEDFVLKVIAPLSPALLLGIRQFMEHVESANRLDTLREHAEKLWSDWLNGKSDRSISSGSRNLQDEIFENRKRNPPVCDAVFKRLRNSYETQMNQNALDLVQEASNKLRLS